MPKAMIDKTDMLDKIADVFRQYGYEGASLSRLVKATGLQRASLYHHFPGGKDEMALTVLNQALQRFVAAVLMPLKEEGVVIGTRLENMAKGLREVYCNGQKSCLLNTFSVDIENVELRQTVQSGFNAWVDGFKKIAIEAGFDKSEAIRIAQNAVIEIQGALVFARITGDQKPFVRITEKLPSMLAYA